LYVTRVVIGFGFEIGLIVTKLQLLYDVALTPFKVQIGEFWGVLI
jgi:hypothetical protein